MTIYHKHHIIPRHVGGTNDPSNIVLLSIEEHAEAHKQLYEKYGRWQDKLAWEMLSGLKSKESMLAELYAIGGKISGIKSKGIPKGGKCVKGHKKSEQTKQKMRKPKSDSHKKAISECQMGEKHWSKKQNITIDTFNNINKLVTCNVCGKTTNAGNIGRWHKH